MADLRQHRLQLQQQIGMCQRMFIHTGKTDLVHEILFADEMKFGKFLQLDDGPAYRLLRLSGLDSDIQLATQ